jgi:alcohol oxidase
VVSRSDDCSARNGRAIGLEYVQIGPVPNPDGDSQVRVVRAAKMVVVAAGAFGSPAILERSGIGAKDVLGRNGVEQVVDLPGVGENYQGTTALVLKAVSHIHAPPQITILEYFLTMLRRKRTRLMISSEATRPKWTVRCVELFRSHITELLDSRSTCAVDQGWKRIHCSQVTFASLSGRIKQLKCRSASGIDAGVKYRPLPHELKEFGPDFEAQWSQYFLHTSDKPVLWFGPMAGWAYIH